MRRERLALVTLWLLLTLISVLIAQVNLLTLPFAALGTLLVVIALYRYGLLATISTLFISHLFVFYSMTTELTAWYATDFTIALVICIALAAYGCYISLAGQPLFGKSLLED